jgi:hypothetical protein
MCRFLVFEIEQNQKMQIAQGSQFHARLVHEYTTAMNGRADGVRRHEQNG